MRQHEIARDSKGKPEIARGGPRQHKMIRGSMRQNQIARDSPRQAKISPDSPRYPKIALNIPRQNKVEQEKGYIKFKLLQNYSKWFTDTARDMQIQPEKAGWNLVTWAKTVRDSKRKKEIVQNRQGQTKKIIQ